MVEGRLRQAVVLVAQDSEVQGSNAAQVYDLALRLLQVWNGQLD